MIPFCRIGRSLEKTGSSTPEVRKDAFDGAASAVLVRLQNAIGTPRELELELVKRFLYGFLVNLKNRGGVWHQDLLPYIQAFGAAWQLSHGGERREATRKRMPDRIYASHLGAVIVDLFGKHGRVRNRDWHHLGKLIAIARNTQVVYS